MVDRSGYEVISDEREGGRLKGWRGVVALVGVVLALVGQLLSWTQTTAWAAVQPDEKAIQKAGAYLTMLLVLAGLNLYSYLAGRLDLRWCTAVVMFEVLDEVIGDAAKSRDEGALFAAYLLSLVGAATTFIVYPISKDDLEKVGDDIQRTGYKRLVFALWVFALATTGSVLIWSGSTNTSDKKYDRDVHASAAFVGLWYFMSVATYSVTGQELAFIYMAIELAKYQPFSNYHADQIPGYILVFASFLLAVGYHLVVDCLGTDPRAWLSEGRNKTRMGIQVACILAALVGAVLVWTGKYTDGYPYAKECWDVATLLLVALFMMLCELTQHPAVAVVSMCLCISVIGNACISINNTAGSAAIRVGYIFLFVGAGASFVSLPIVWNTSFTRTDADALMASAETKAYFQSSLAVFCAVLYLWSEQQYEGQLGFFSMIVMIAITQNFAEGMQWVYVVALWFIPRLTPFTASLETNIPASGTNKIALLVCFFSVLNLVYYHYTKFSVSAFTNVRLFTRWTDNGIPAEAAPDSDAGEEEAGVGHRSVRTDVAPDDVPGAE